MIEPVARRPVKLWPPDPPVALALVLIISFAALTALVVSGLADVWDADVLRAAYDARPESARSFFVGFSYIGTYYGVAVGCATVCILLAIKRRFGEAAFFAGCIGAIWLLNEIIKFAVARERPGLGSEPFATGYSFPSAHAMVGGAMILLLATFASMETRNRMGKIAIWTTATIIFVLLAYSRIFLGVHYPTDMLGGALLGIASAALARGFWMKYLLPEVTQN